MDKFFNYYKTKTNKNTKIKKYRNRNSGITLIALVVTIVVLLILAGISIGALTSDNGIINQTHDAKNDTEYAGWEEQIDLAIIDAENKHREPSLDDIKEELKNKGVIDDYSQVDKDGVITTNEPVYEIAGKLDDYLPFVPGKFATKNEEYTDETSEEEYKTVTVPEGFQILPDKSKIDDGLVIQDKNGSQFVWIPVSDINDMAQCSKAGGSCKLKLEGNELRCTTHTSTETESTETESTEIYIVGKLYARTTGESFGTVNTTYNPNSGLREPAVVTGSSSGTGTSYDGDSTNLSQLGYSKYSEFLTALKDQYKEMATSVAKYKGFYVGRYELGLEGDTPVSKNASENSSTVTTASADSSSLKNWYGLYKKCSEYKVPEINDSSVTSTMIWGSQYDAMLNFMKRRGEESSITSTSNTSKQNNSYVTGQGTNDVISNVFDLYACHREWTLEAYSYNSRVRRGGYSGLSDSPSCRGYGYPTLTYSNSSSRLTLYIK